MFLYVFYIPAVPVDTWGRFVYNEAGWGSNQPKVCRKGETFMPRQSIFDMKFSKVYPLLLQKAERKGRAREEVDAVISWLTGYDMETTDLDVTCRTFFDGAPAYNPRAELITGKVCGVQVETIPDPLMKKIRQLDKLVDELAQGRPMEKILR